MHERIKRILKGKNQETEMKNGGGGGVFRMHFSLEGKVGKRGVTPYPNFYNILCDISLLTISSNRLVSHYLKIHIHR
jgi:hypothetical protein